MNNRAVRSEYSFKSLEEAQKILPPGTNLWNRFDDHGGEFLVEAAKKGDLPLLKYLETLNPVLDYTPLNTNMSAMAFAAEAGYLDCVKFLCEAGANIYVSLDSRTDPLFLAKKEGKADVVSFLIGVYKTYELYGRVRVEKSVKEFESFLEKEGENIFGTVFQKKILLHAVIRNRGIEAKSIIQFLVDKGLNVDAQDRHGETPLMCALSGTFNHATAYALIKAGADFDYIKNYAGKTAFDMAEGARFDFVGQRGSILSLMQQARIERREKWIDKMVDYHMTLPKGGMVIEPSPFGRKRGMKP